MVRLTASTERQDCGRVEASGIAGSPGSAGTAYLVAPTIAITCAHVVQHLVEATEGHEVKRVAPGGTITVAFGDQAISASIERLDAKTDVAVLRLATAPTAVDPLALGTAHRGPCSLLSHEADAAPAHAVLVNTDVRNKYGDPRMTLRAPELADRMLNEGQALSGTPILSEGGVVGHVLGAVQDPNDASYSFAGLVEAVSSGEVRDLLGPLAPPPPVRAPVTDGTSGFVPPSRAPDLRQRVTAPEIGKRESHAFVSFRAIERNRMNDGTWTHGLMDRLGTLGFQCFSAPHVLFGNGSGGRVDSKTLCRSRVGLIVYSQRWTEGPPFAPHVKPLLKRAKKDPENFRIVVVTLDDTPLPDRLSGVRTIQAGDRQITVGKQRMPDAATVLEVAAVLHDLSSADGPGRRGGGSAEETSLLAPSLARSQEYPIEATGLTVDPTSSVGDAADVILRHLAEAKKQPGKIRALAMRWLDAGMPGSDVPVEAARLLVGVQAHDAALEVLDRASKQEEAKDDPSSRDLARIRRMRGAALGEAGRLDEAIAALERLSAAGQLDQWSGGILGSAYKKKWLKLGGRRRALLQKSFDVYYETYARTLHYYPGINAATLAMQLGQEDLGREIAQAIRVDLESHDDLYYWDEASLGEAYLLLGEWDKALEAYSRAAVMVMDNLKDMSRMRSQIPLILGRERREKDPEIKRVWDILMGPSDPSQEGSGLFRAGGVAAFVGPGLGLTGRDGSLVEERERLLRRRVSEVLTKHDVSMGFCSAAAGSDILFAEGVLERSGTLHVSLPYNRAAFREDVPAGQWRDRFDRILASEGVQVVELRDGEPREGDDLAAALAECADDVLDRAIKYGRGIDTDPVMVVVSDPSVEVGLEARARRAGTDEGLVTEVIDLGERTEVPTATDAGAAPDPAPPVGMRGVRMAGSSPPSLPPGSYRKKHLLIVGIDKYMNWRPLENARHDAEGIKRVLTEQYGFELSGELFDRSATAGAIERAFQLGLAKGEAGSEGDDARWGLSGPAEPDDLVVFFFAGHGHTERRPNDDEVGFLVPVEAPREGKAGMLRISMLREWTEDLASRHVLYVFDSCFSGAATTGGGGGGKPGYARRVITAGAPDQVVADGGDKFGHHSVFTGRLLFGLGPEETTLVKPVFAKELASYLERHVPEDARALNSRMPQTPSEGVLPGHGGAHIVLQRTVTEAAQEEDDDSET